MKIYDFPLGTAHGGIPTALGVPPSPELPFLFGEAAFDAPDGYALVTNWKLLLGKTDKQVLAARSENDAYERALSRFDLSQLAEAYFGHLINTVMQSNRFEKIPEFVIGIPSGTAETLAARSRFRKTIETAFARLNAPRPHFFPEPFAVFQYHWFRGDIADIGRPQNVMIIDIGGGTTNVCVIQTSGHGRLARGGDNHKPHGVSTFDAGGTAIDQYILERVVLSTRIREVSKAFLLARQAKEKIASILNERNLWSSPDASRVTTEIDLGTQGKWQLTGHDLSRVIEHSFWPRVKATVDETLAELQKAKTGSPIETIDAVIFAGGTCRIALLQQLFMKHYAARPMFSQHKTVISPNFDRAVAGGLAIEACANSRIYEVRPTRVAPYIQSDILLETGHSISSLEAPLKFRQIEPADIPGKAAVLLQAPMSVSDLLGKKLLWQFQLRQRPEKIFLRLLRSAAEQPEPILDVCSIKVAKRGDSAGTQCKLQMLFHDDGVADVGLLAWDSKVNAHVHFDVARLDLHDLHQARGEVFVGLDFGTTNTFISQVEPSTARQDALPDRYSIDPKVRERAQLLEDSAKSLLKMTVSSGAVVARFEKVVLKDYVYHSNRIEGSALSRGQTTRILSEISDDISLTARDIQSNIECITFVDDDGEVRTVSRPIKDEIAAVNLRDAFIHVQELAAHNVDLTPFYLREIHSLVARKDESSHPGEYRRDKVTISQTSFVPPEATQIGSLIEEMCDFFRSDDFRAWPAIYRAAYAHARFVSIHPFADGNGRLARLIANYFMWRAGLPSLLLPWENRERYYDALEECNSHESITRGNLTDLTTLFCDLFEDALENIKTLSAEEAASAASVDKTQDPIIAGSAKSKRLNDLLLRIGPGRRAMNLEDQYKTWSNAFSSLLSDVREGSELVGNAFRQEWGGSILVREYPIIDFETYRAIREARPYSRTWYFNLKIALPNCFEDLVFFFGSCSQQARALDESLHRTASLKLSRMDRSQGKHVSALREPWTRIKEITHNGTRLGYCLEEEGTFHQITADQPAFSDWFAILMEDVTMNLAKLNLDT